jgi:hypothetical protein
MTAASGAPMANIFGASFGVESPKCVCVAIHVPPETIEAFKKTDPLFTEFLIESGRVIVDGNMPCKMAGVQRNDIKNSCH